MKVCMMYESQDFFFVNYIAFIRQQKNIVTTRSVLLFVDEFKV